MIQQIVMLKSGQNIYSDAGELLYRNEDFTLPSRPSRAYAYCSDTAYFPSLTEQIKDLDLLYHEATFLTQDQEKANKTMHSTAQEAAAIAKQGNAKKLIIGHFSARYHSTEVLLTEARQTFLETYLAIEGETFNIEE